MSAVELAVVGVAATAFAWLLVVLVVTSVVQRSGSVAAGPAREAKGVRAGLGASRRRLRELLEQALDGQAGPVFDGLEEALIGADVGVKTSTALIARVRTRVGGEAPSDAVREVLRAEMLEMLSQGGPQPVPTPGEPHVVLVVGVNGVGKTTTVGKLAAAHQAAGRRVLLVAADTFRAAAVEQLQVWGNRLGVEVVHHESGVSPAAVAFDAMKRGRATQCGVILVDTAGRLHTRKSLVEELRKVRRVIAEGCPGAPHQTLLVLDSTTGQNALSQARAFMEAVDVTGVVLTKLDGTARGGIALAVAQDLGLAISHVGVGEHAEDLRAFDPAEFVSALLDIDPTD